MNIEAVIVKTTLLSLLNVTYKTSRFSLLKYIYYGISFLFIILYFYERVHNMHSITDLTFGRIKIVKEKEKKRMRLVTLGIIGYFIILC